MEIVDTSAIRLDPRNYRAHNKRNKELINKSLRECGAGRSVVMDSEGALIAGNGVYEQAQKLKIPTKIVETDGSELIVVRRKDLKTADKKRQKLAVFDNSASDSSEFKLDVMKVDFTPAELADLGVENPNVVIEEERQVVEDISPIQTESRAALGDIWQLGKHRLLVGDSTKTENLARLMNGAVADLLLTDPPYNVDYEGSNGKKIANDKMSPAQFATFLKNAFIAASAQLKPGGVFYVFHADTETINFRTACSGAGLTTRQCLIWNKNAPVLGRQDYNWKHEPCLYGWKDGAAHYFVDDRTQSTVFEDKGVDFKKLKKEELVQLLQNICAAKVSTSVIDCDKPSRSEEHPTMKPVKLLALQIRNSSRMGETVLDIFGGSGSTLIACEQLGRKARLVELDPKYCDVILDRWEKLTGGTAKLCK